MAALKLQDFSDLVRAIRNELKIQSTDVESINRIKQTINMMYIDEIVPFKRWWWLTGSSDVQTIPFYADGTANVSPTSTTVTLSVAPPTANGSYKDYYFSTDDYDEVYTISAHTAGSTTITLSKPFTNSLNTAVAFKIWTDKIGLPTDLREAIEIRHDFMRMPMRGVGFQELRKLISSSPKANGRPSEYNVTDYRDPTPNDGETETDRYRILQIYPSISDKTVTMHVDYVREAIWLDDDSDEPLMPVEDRVVLFYGALSQLQTSLLRNPEEAARNYGLYQAKLARMAGKIEEGFDKPTLVPDSSYMRAKRGNRIRSSSSRNFTGASGGGGANIPTYARNITIEGGVFTANMTASPGVTIDGRDLSVDAALTDAHIAASSDVHGIGPGNDVVGTGTAQTITNKTITAETNTITSVSVDSVAIFSPVTGALAGSTLVNPTELSYLDGAIPLTSVVLADNQVAAADVFTVAATQTVIQVTYSIRRTSSNVEHGTILITNDGTNAAISINNTMIGTTGVNLTADVNGGNVRLRYTSTNTGTAPVFQYKAQNWVA